MSNSLDHDQARRFVGPDLDPNCLPRLSADDTGRQRVNAVFIFSLSGTLFMCSFHKHIQQVQISLLRFTLRFLCGESSYPLKTMYSFDKCMTILQ